MHLDAAADEGVLPHEQLRLAADAPTDGRELGGADVVCLHYEHTGVLIQQLAKLHVVVSLPVDLGDIFLDPHRYPPETLTLRGELAEM